MDSGLSAIGESVLCWKVDEHAGPWDQLRQNCQMVWLGRMSQSHIGQELGDWAINKAYWTFGQVLSLKGNIQPYLKGQSLH